MRHLKYLDPTIAANGASHSTRFSTLTALGMLAIKSIRAAIPMDSAFSNIGYINFSA